MCVWHGVGRRGVHCVWGHSVQGELYVGDWGVVDNEKAWQGAAGRTGHC